MHEDGIQATSHIKSRAVDFFKELYDAQPRSPQIADVDFTSRLTAKICAWLRCLPRLEEIKHTLWLFPPNKSPGPDGIPAEIYRVH